MAWPAWRKVLGLLPGRGLWAGVNWFSPLVRPILAVNVLALVILVAGILFLGRYEDRLIDAELDVLTLEGRLVANALGEGAVVEGEAGRNRLGLEPAEAMIRRLAETGQRRLQLYDTNGEMLLDSRRLLASGDPVEVAELPPPSHPVLQAVEAFFRRLGQHLGIASALRESAGAGKQGPSAGAQKPELADALAGEEASELRRSDDGRLQLSVAVPVQAYREIIGALRVSGSGEDVAASIAAVRANILQVFVVVLGITLALSLYLAWRLAAPIRRLARAAERVRRAQGWAEAEALPDFSHRRDEIGELSRALRAMTAELWRRLEATEKFAADVAHELKNPISSMQSALDTLQRVRDEGKRQRLLGILNHDVDRLNRLISDISAASRLEGLLARGNYELVDLAGLLARVIAPFQREDGPAVRFDRSHGKYLVRGLHGRLEEVFENIIANACTFSPPSAQVRLALEPAGAVSADDQSGQDWLQVVVDDEGPGVPESAGERIFERFYSDRPADERFGEHSGIGLSLAKQVVEAHGGKIHARNRYDPDGRIMGARFVVALPRVPDDSGNEPGDGDVSPGYNEEHR